MFTILVTGGAGYVGSHCCFALAKAGYRVVVYDDLSNGHERFVKWGPLVRGDIRDKAELTRAFSTHKPDAVLHCAALIEVGESVKAPERFYDVNVRGALTVLETMLEAQVKPFVFSSTCAVYGQPQTPSLAETHPRAPESPYGWTKLAIEQASADFARAHGLRYAHMRYFNAAGAAPEQGIGEQHEPETHLIPLAIQATLGLRPPLTIFGDDYDTRDGTCLRDYTHVLDLADAHVIAMERLLHGGGSLACNLGTGAGATVRELLAEIERVTGRPAPANLGARRPGDVSALVADTTFARSELGWTPRRSLNDVIQSAWDWHAQTGPRTD